VTILVAIEIALALAISCTLCAVAVALVWWFDRCDREPRHLVVVAATLGVGAALLTHVVMLRLMTGVPPRLGPTIAMISVPGAIVAELAKTAGMVLLFWFSQRNEGPSDAMVVGTVVGLGSAAASSILGVLSTGSEAGLTADLAHVAATAAVNGVSSAAVGALLGLALLGRQGLVRAGWVTLGLVGACGVHGWWANTVLRASSGIVQTQWLVTAGGFVAWILLFAGSLEVERRILRHQLTEEVRLGVLPGWVVEVVPRYSRRIRPDWWPDRRERTVISRLLTRVALRKHTLEWRPSGEHGLAGLEVVHLRDRARRILGPRDNDDSS
jgi:RsiW-degrading membrane proteinase PrsW (M82 family)